METVGLEARRVDVDVDRRDLRPRLSQDLGGLSPELAIDERTRFVHVVQLTTTSRHSASTAKTPRSRHPTSALRLHDEGARRQIMKYGVAWLLGIPPVIILAWFALNHC